MADRECDDHKEKGRPKKEEVHAHGDGTRQTKTYEIIKLPPNYEVGVSYDASKQSLFSYLVANVTLFLLMGLFYIMPISLIVCLYYIIVHGSIIATTFLIVMIGSTFYPSHILWQDCIDCWIWKTLCEYFSFTLIRPKGQFAPSDCFLFVGK